MKTIKVEDVKEFVNQCLLHSPDENESERHGMATVLEEVLHKTNNYHGFAYLSPHDMQYSTSGKTPGINHYEEEEIDTRFEKCLPFRRVYF